MADLLPLRTDILDGILDRVYPPVPRSRIISAGLAQNHTLKVSDDLSGTRACLACGNCVDACPVVASKPEGTMFVRTSMLLEHVVADECRRCYRCVASCPQVSRPIKDYVRGFRRVERASHWDLLASYLILMVTGVLMNHWGNELPPDLRTIFSVVHRIFTVGLVAASIFLFLYDRHHFSMIARRVLTWTAEDKEWMSSTWAWLTSSGKRGVMKRGAYNPGQRFWYIYVPTAVVVFAITGAIKWLGPQVVGQGMIDAATLVHVTVAVMTDVLLVLHIYLKLVLPVLRDFFAGYKQYNQVQEHRKGIAASIRAR